MFVRERRQVVLLAVLTSVGTGLLLRLIWVMIVDWAGLIKHVLSSIAPSRLTNMLATTCSVASAFCNCSSLETRI